jgi:nucleotide-binding universal stress UspA family protein
VSSGELPVVDRVVVGHDGSDGAGRAVRWTAALAHRLGAHVVVVRAYSPLEELGQAEPPIDFAALERQRRHELESEWCAVLAEAGVSFEARLLEEPDPVSAIARVASEVEADLVVVGSHGQTGWRERILGRVATKLPYEVACPVTIVPLRPAPATS